MQREIGRRRGEKVKTYRDIQKRMYAGAGRETENTEITETDKKDIKADIDTDKKRQRQRDIDGDSETDRDSRLMAHAGA